MAAESDESLSVDKAQVELAVAALLKYIETTKEKSLHLMNENELIWMLLALKKVPGPDRKPKRIPLPHSLYSNTTDVCLFSKDKGSTVKEHLKKNGVTSVTKVINTLKLRKNYKSYESRRQLLATFDLFLCDDRIYHFLPKLLGKEFFRRKKFPIPVDLSKTDLNGELNKAMQCTLMQVGAGTCIGIRIAHTGMTAEQVVENIVSGVCELSKKVSRGWTNIQSLNIKTSDSIALPIYNSLPEHDEIKEVNAESEPVKKKRKAKAGKNKLEKKKTGTDAEKVAIKTKRGSASKNEPGKKKRKVGEKIDSD